MTAIFDSVDGSSPLLVSVPHDGRLIPDNVRARMTTSGSDIADTDWHVAELYGFVRDLGASLIVANYSRYVVDLNRAANDEALYEGQIATGLCPSQSFAGEDLYLGGAEVDADERRMRINAYWRPYHEHVANKLAAIKQSFGYALLWDAHSIPSRVPRLFNGKLPVLNLGSWEQRSCANELCSAVARQGEASGYSFVHNGRFKGGYITRNYGRPGDDVHALQLEVSQRAYMNEASRKYDAAKANVLRDTLSRMIAAYLKAAEKHYE